MGSAILWLIDTVFEIAIWLVIASAIMSWLVAFNVVNPRNTFVYQAGRFLEAVTNPMLRPIRRFVPLLGGIDISPIILILALGFLQKALHGLLGPMLISY